MTYSPGLGFVVNSLWNNNNNTKLVENMIQIYTKSVFSKR